jgi:hypothetical protein
MSKKKKREPYKNPDGQIVDYFGVPVRKGDIIIHGYRGQQYGEPFDCGVFIKENKSTLTIAKFKKSWGYGSSGYTESVQKTAIRKSSGLMQPLIVVNNPLFALDNPRISKALELIDSLKSNGDLPQDFEAGITNQRMSDGEE